MKKCVAMVIEIMGNLVMTIIMDIVLKFSFKKIKTLTLIDIAYVRSLKKRLEMR